MTTNINEKYLPEHEIPNLDSTMELSDLTDTCEILVLALPSSVILSVVNDLIPLLRPSHVLIDLAKGLAPTAESESGMISQEVESRLSANGKGNPVLIISSTKIYCSIGVNSLPPNSFGHKIAANPASDFFICDNVLHASADWKSWVVSYRRTSP